MPVFDVHVTDRKLPIFEANPPPAFDEFVKKYRDEIAFAKDLLCDAPEGTQLHCHYQGNQLSYTNQKTQKKFLLEHTYVKVKEVKNRIFVKLVRQMKLGSGAYGVVKSLFDVDTGEQIVEKKAIDPDKPLKENIIAHDHDGFIANVERLRHPLKWIDESGMQSLDANNALHFISSEINGRVIEIAGKKRKTIHYFQYLGKNLIDFFKESKDQLTEASCINLASAMINKLYQLHVHENGLIHCDIKPGNTLVFLDKKEKQYIVSFCDFDFATKINPGFHSRVKGTFPYTAPELICWREAEHFKGALHSTLTPRTVIKKIYPTARLEADKFQYTTASDVFALSVTVEIFFREFRKASNPQLNQLYNLFKLMRCYHPKGRPSLRLMQWVMILFESKDVTEESLPDILRERKLPEISLVSLKELTKILIIVASNLAHDSPIAWPIMIWLQQRIETVVFSDNPLAEAALATQLQAIENLARFFVFLAENFQFNPCYKNSLKIFQRSHEPFKSSAEVTDEMIDDHSIAAKTLFDAMNALVCSVEKKWDAPGVQAQVFRILDPQRKVSNFSQNILFHIFDPSRNLQHTQSCLDFLYAFLGVWKENQLVIKIEEVQDLLQSNEGREVLRDLVQLIFYERISTSHQLFFQAISQKNVHTLIPAVFSCFSGPDDGITRMVQRLFCYRPPQLSPSSSIRFMEADALSKARAENALIATVIRYALERCIVVVSGKESVEALSAAQRTIVECIETQLNIFFTNPAQWKPIESVQKKIGGNVIQSIRSLLDEDRKPTAENTLSFIQAVVRVATKSGAAAPAFAAPSM